MTLIDWRETVAAVDASRSFCDEASRWRLFDWVDALDNYVSAPSGELAYRCFVKRHCTAMRRL